MGGVIGVIGLRVIWVRACGQVGWVVRAIGSDYGDCKVL
jgi:hypothetical protein